MATITRLLTNRYSVLTGLAHLPLALSRGTLRMLSVWQQRYSQRRQLQRLSDAMLKDIGLSRADVDGESRKPFWQA